MLNLVQIQDRLKDMPTQAVMSYANGSNPMVPPYLALGELNRRKNMTQMATAEQARMQGEQPTVKESTEQQLGLMNLQKQRAMQAQQGMGRAMANAPAPVPAGVGEEPVQMARGGIARLPARNLRRDAYAGGGIVAFYNGGPIPGVSLTEEELREKYPNLDISDPSIQRQIRQKERYSSVKDESPRLLGPGIGGGKPDANKAYLAEDFTEDLKRLFAPIADAFTNKKAAQREEALSSAPSYAERQRELSKFESIPKRTEPVVFEQTKVADVKEGDNKPVIERKTNDNAGLPAVTPKSDLERYEAELKKRGLDVRPEATRGIEALRKQRELYEAPVYKDWTEGLLGTVQDIQSGQAVGSARLKQEKENKKALADIELKVAQAEDLNAKAEYEFNRGNFDKAIEYERKAKDLEIQASNAKANMISATKPNQLEAWVSLYKKDPEAALRYLGQAKAGTFTMEDALKAVANDPMNTGLTDQQKVQKARDLFNLMNQSNASSNVTLTKEQQALLNKYK